MLRVFRLPLVLLSGDEDDRHVLVLLLDLVVPSFDVIERGHVVDGEAEHDDISALSDCHSVLMPSIAADIENACLDGLLLFFGLGASIEVDDRGLVVVLEVSVVEI